MNRMARMARMAQIVTRRPGRTARGAAALVAAVVLLAPAAALASRLLYLARDERLCDGRAGACIEATLTYEVNSRILWLRGRVVSAPGPGLWQVVVRGANRLGHVRRAPVEVRIRGRRSEIVDTRMIPDHPDVEDWAIDVVRFIPDPPD